MKTVIITGWGWTDYACAAALALRCLKTADVRASSARRLPEILEEMAENGTYTHIYITGVSLAGDPKRTCHALQKLKKNGAELTWMSALELPEDVAKMLCGTLSIFVDGASVLEAVSMFFNHAPFDRMKPMLNPKTNAPNAVAYQQLFAAAMYVYRNYQDEAAYIRAITYLAHDKAPSEWQNAEKRYLEHYKRYGNRELVGCSEKHCALLAKINRIAVHDHARVLILGESGTGKETVAQQLHNKSPRRNEPFIAFNCASVTPNLLETRFFGYERGAFTGANSRKLGLFEQANGGTLFLDEIGELPLEAQGILLRVLEEGRFMRLGGHEEIEVDVRLIAATNRDLSEMVAQKMFREDLYYRLNVIQILVPPLRERPEDIGRIADAWWFKRFRKHLPHDGVEVLTHYAFPGNVRELINVLERAEVLGENNFEHLLAEHREMAHALQVPHVETPACPDDLESMIRLHVQHVYEKYNHNLSQAAAALNASRNTVRKYLDKE